MKVLGVGIPVDNPHNLHPRIFTESEGGFRTAVDQNLHHGSTWVNTGTDLFENAGEGEIVTDNGAVDCPSAESEHRWFEQHGPRSTDPILRTRTSRTCPPWRAPSGMARQSVAPPEDSPHG